MKSVSGLLIAALCLCGVAVAESPALLKAVEIGALQLPDVQITSATHQAASEDPGRSSR